MKTNFQLIGLKSPDSVICGLVNNEISFEAKSKLPAKRFKTMLQFARSDDYFWQQQWLVVIQHDGFQENGLPVNPYAIDIQENSS